MLFWPTTRQDSKVRFTVRPAAIGVCCKVTRHSRLVPFCRIIPLLWRSTGPFPLWVKDSVENVLWHVLRNAISEPLNRFPPRTGSHIAGTQIGKSNCFGIGWGFGLLVGWTLCSYDTQLAPHQRDTLVGQHHSLFSPVSRSYCQARAHAAFIQYSFLAWFGDFVLAYHCKYVLSGKSNSSPIPGMQVCFSHSLATIFKLYHVCNQDFV